MSTSLSTSSHTFARKDTRLPSSLLPSRFSLVRKRRFAFASQVTMTSSRWRASVLLLCLASAFLALTSFPLSAEAAWRTQDDVPNLFSAGSAGSKLSAAEIRKNDRRLQGLPFFNFTGAKPILMNVNGRKMLATPLHLI